MKSTFWLLFGISLLVTACQQSPRASIMPRATPLRVACVGASITAGFGTQDRARENYAVVMQETLGSRYVIRNFGVSGTTVLKNGDRPYAKTSAYQQALEFQPDIVVIDLGGNDSKAMNWAHAAEFADDTLAMIASFRSLGTTPRILLCLPMPSFRPPGPGVNDDIITKEIIPTLRKVAFETHTEILDLHTPFVDKTTWFADGIHPNATGARLMAEQIGRIIDFRADEKFDFSSALAEHGFSPAASSFFGFRQLDFTLPDGRAATVTQPHRPAASRPVVWRGEFYGHQPQTDLALLQLGYHVVYIKTSNLYGAPVATRAWENFHGLLQQCGLTGKLTLIGMSRGGLYCYNWAALHPETVAVIYGDAPVCDFKSWPGQRGRSDNGAKLWPELIKAYGFKNEAEALAYTKNPIDNLKPLARAGVAIIHVIGEADTAAPVEENSDLVETRYRALGGTIKVIRKPGAAHHPHSLPNSAPIVDFILEHNS